MQHNNVTHTQTHNSYDKTKRYHDRLKYYLKLFIYFNISGKGHKPLACQ